VTLLASLALAVALAHPPAGPSDPHPVFTVQDPRIDESSALVDLGNGLMVTSNDSGDTAIVYVLDGSGRTVGTTRFGGSTDAESMAPAGDGRVWVGDTGDNARVRPDIVLHKVPVGRGDRTVTAPAYRLAYPDGAHDAETLLRQPHTGRLYVVTKELLSSAVYAAPRILDPGRVNRLTRVAGISLTPTDGAFFPDGRHLILRGYGSADVYTFPAFHLVGGFPLPAEPQGESLSIGPGGRIRVGSEGVRQPVLRVRLPDSLAARMSPTPGPSASPSRAGDTRRPSGETGPVSDRGAEQWIFLSLLGAVLVALGGLVTAARRVRRHPGPGA
jgi:hypothetical protein